MLAFGQDRFDFGQDRFDVDKLKMRIFIKAIWFKSGAWTRHYGQCLHNQSFCWNIARHWSVSRLYFPWSRVLGRDPSVFRRGDV